jgi:hypothetical protein
MSALDAHRLAEMGAAIGAVGEYLARRVGQRRRPRTAVVDVGWGDDNRLDERRIGVGTDMGLEAMNGRPLCLTQRASSSSSLADAMIVASTMVPVFTCTAFAFSWRVTASNRARSRPAATRALRKRTKAVRSGVGSVLEKPQNRRNEARSSSASASFTSDRSYQTDTSSPLNIASGGHAASPLALAWIGFSRTVIGCQSISAKSSSNDEH